MEAATQRSRWDRDDIFGAIVGSFALLSGGVSMLLSHLNVFELTDSLNFWYFRGAVMMAFIGVIFLTGPAVSLIRRS